VLSGQGLKTVLIWFSSQLELGLKIILICYTTENNMSISEPT